MQRQSLGSPSSKLVKDEQQLCSETQKQLSSTCTLMNGSECCKDEEEEEELNKKLKPRTTSPQSYIHLIPLLTLLCFLILYLSSHHPSQYDLAQFNGLNAFDAPAVEIKKADILAIRSLKNLKQEADAAKNRRRHRKIARF